MYKRHRKLRNSSAIRNLVKNIYLEKGDLIYPIFIEEGENIKREINSMPGIFRYSIDRLDEEMEELKKLGISSILLFGIPLHKDECATEGYNENGVIQNAIRYIKKKYPEFLVIGDVCCCEYTSHGHCGILDEKGNVKNDETLEVLSKIGIITTCPFPLTSLLVKVSSIAPFTACNKRDCPLPLCPSYRL